MEGSTACWQVKEAAPLSLGLHVQSVLNVKAVYFAAEEVLRAVVAGYGGSLRVWHSIQGVFETEASIINTTHST